MSAGLPTNPFAEAVRAERVAEATSADAVDGILPEWVVAPESADEVAATLGVARRRGLSVVSRGLGRHMTLGNPPRRVDVILSLERMNRILAYEPADMTVRVEAGCSLRALAATLSEGHQWLPLDPPHAEETTVGGVLATNLSGPLRASQGTARDLLIGIRTVGPDGTIVSGGGKVVKNVAGYDLPKMHIGALGTLGVILDATFKVRPRPQDEGALEITCESETQAAHLCLQLRDASEPLWLQITNDADSPKDWRVLAGAGGRREDVTTALERYRQLSEAIGARARPVPNAPRIRQQIADASAHGEDIVLRAATLPTRIGDVLTDILRETDRIGTVPRLHADPICGVLRVGLDANASEHLAAWVTGLRPKLEREGGSLVVERASAAQKKRLLEAGDVWGEPGPALSLMRGLKEAFDPSTLFAPGRFVGGL